MTQTLVARRGSRIQGLKELGDVSLGLMDLVGSSLGWREVGRRLQALTEEAWRLQAGFEESRLLQVARGGPLFQALTDGGRHSRLGRIPMSSAARGCGA